MNDELAALVRAPLFFERNRVARVYRGGRLFHELFGDPPEDGYFPEEWVASTVRALNRVPSSPTEGLSVLRAAPFSLRELIERAPREVLGRPHDAERPPALEILVKALDSSIRLPVQAHPSKELALHLFGSRHGKTEMWIILATRPGACVYYGLRDGVTRSELVTASRASEGDRDALPALLNQIAVAKGDVYLIPAGVAHAVGPGCLILEVQEPTDFTIQPEAWCGEYRLSPYEMYLGLDESAAFDCFDFMNLVGRRALDAGKRAPRVRFEGGGARTEALIGPEDTLDFAVNRHVVAGGYVALAAGPAVCFVTEGRGRLAHELGERELRRGDYFLIPAAAGSVRVESSGELELVECLPPP